MGRDREAGRPVEPNEARATGNDPDAVEVHRAGSSGHGDGNSRPRELREIPADGGEVHAEGHREVVVPRDSARWGPIWAGLITALTTFLLLELLAFGTGILTPNLAPGSDPTASAWVTAVIGLIAFFTGGSVAGMTSAMRGAATGALNGFMVWALGTVLILVLSVLGLGQLFGALGNLVGQFNLIGQATSPGGPVNLPQNVNPQQYLDTVRTTAFWGFVSLAIAAAVSALGGYLGGRTDEPIGKIPDAG